MPPLFTGRTIADVGDVLDGDLLGDDPKRSWRDAAEGAKGVVDGDGAMDRIVHISMGDVPGAEYAFQVLADLAIHGWDLARAIGANEAIDPDVLEAIDPWYQAQMGSWKASGYYGGDVEVAEDADRQTKLLGLLGRKA